jgi:tetratricopeptide (TPR) repeat protein
VITVESSADEQEELALAALPLLEAADDHAGLAEVWASLASSVYNARGHLAQMEHASEEALRHATLAGQHQTSLWMLPLALVHGPRPAGEAFAKLDALYPHPWTNLNRAALLAMSDRIEEARTVAGAAEDHLRELGDEGGHAHALVATVERIAGNDEAAAERLRRAADYAAEHGETAFLSTYVLMRAHTLCALGRYEEAEPLARQGREFAHEDDAALWRQVAALVRAHHGDHAEAERLAREAVSLMRETDSPWWQGDALYDLGEVLAAAGNHEAAAAAFEEALALYERKQIVPLARRTRERLAALQPLQT